MISNSLCLYRLEIPWFLSAAPLILAVPKTKRPTSRDLAGAANWDSNIREGLMELGKGGVFEETWGEEEPRMLKLIDWKADPPEQTFKWQGWRHLVLPDGITFGLDGEWPIPMQPSKNHDEWPHDFWGMENLKQRMEQGESVLQFHPKGLATAGYLAAILSLLADREVHPHKVAYPVLHSGLGLSPFHYGLLLGVDLAEHRRWR